MGWIGVITNAGATAIAQVAGGGHTLTVTRASIGTGTRAEANLRTATALVSEVGDISIANKKEITGGVQLRLRVLPAATTGYTAHEIGVWGKVDSGSEILIQLHQDSGTGIPVPTEAESPEFLFDFIAALAISNTERLTITIDPDIYASKEEVDAKLDKNQGSAAAGKFLRVGNDGEIVPDDVTMINIEYGTEETLVIDKSMMPETTIYDGGDSSDVFSPDATILDAGDSTDI